MAWYDDAADVVFSIPCGEGGDHHRLRWSGGTLELEAHDAEGEALLAALGGAAPACLDLLELWKDAIADGGFLDEWADRLTPSWQRTQWLKIAVARVRTERVQDFLYGLELDRAERMGEVLASFPPELQDRAAATHVDLCGRGLDAPMAAAIRRAIRLRARHAFVASLADRPEAGVAPLVWFRCDVRPGPPSVAGVLDGRSSWCRIGVEPAWLAEVWGRGLASRPGGAFVLGVQPANRDDPDHRGAHQQDAHHHGGGLEALTIRWTGSDGALRAEVGSGHLPRRRPTSPADHPS